MASAISYIRNVGKSVAYSSIDVIKEMNPAISDFAETNSGLMKDMYTSVRTLKKRAKDIPTKVMESQYGKFAKSFRDNLMDDLKTGKFYNKERIERDEMSAAMNMMGVDEEDGDFRIADASDFDFDGNDEPSANEMMDLVGEKASMAVANATARSAEYIVQGQTEIARSQYNQLNAIYGGLHQGLGTINKNISSLVTFASESATTHYNNSKTFFETSNAADNEKITLLKDILENVKALNNPLSSEDKNKGKFSDQKNTYSDLVSASGMVDLNAFKENMLKNLKNTVGMTDILEMITETGALMTFASSPISFITNMIIPNVMPKILKGSMENLNKSLSGLFGSAMMALSKKSREKGGMWSKMAEIFGFDNRLKTSIDPSKYEKGKVAFDGITRKSIVEVIPTYLSKIYSAVSGQTESRYDYEKGKFVTIDDLKKEMENMLQASAFYATSDVDQIVRNKKKNYKFSDKESKAFDADWEALKEYMLKNQTVINTRSKSRASSYGLKGGMASDINLEIIKRMLDGNAEMIKLADNIMQARDQHTSQMQMYESRGDSVLASLSNNSIDTSSTRTKTPVSSIDNGIIAELKEIHKEISYIRTYGIGQGGKRGKAKTSKKPSFDSYTLKTRTGNNTEYDKKQVEYESYPDMTDEELSSHIEGMLVSGKKENIKDKEPSFYDKVKEASGISAKMAVIVKSATEIARKPATFVASMFDAADNRLYDLIYGPKEDKTGKKSFIGRLFKNLDKMFDKFAKFIDDTIVNPLKGKFTKENAHKAAQKFFSFFGIDIDYTIKSAKERLFGDNGFITKTKESLKKEFSNAKQWVKDAFNDVAGWFGVDLDKRKKSKSLSKQLDDIRKGKDQQPKEMETKVEDIPTAATGMRRMDKTGLAILSEGEMVIPPDMNPYNIQKRKRNEKAVKDDIKKYGIDPSSIPTFAEGGEFIGPMESEEQLKKRKKDLEYQHLEEAMEEQANIFFRFIGNHVKGTMEKMGLINNDKDMEKLKKRSTNLLTEVKDALPSIAVGGTIGAGLSLITGFVGGPLVGAAIGSAIGLAKRSETFQNMLFGEMKNGEYEGNLIPKHIANNIHKYLPDMAKGATVGGILTALPIIPGGPVAGIVIGSAIGFAKNNESVQNSLFGEGKLFKSKEEFHKKVSSVLPKMGLGAIAGLLAGPFGLTTNLILGSALGFASDTNKFKDFMFGTPDQDDNGNRKGGLFGAVTEPAIRFFQDMFDEFKTFTREKVMQPLKDAFDPLAQQLKLMVSAVTNHFKDKINMSVGQPLERLMKRMSEKIFGGIGKVLGWITKPIKFAVSLPFKAIGGIGNAARKHQIKTGGTGRTMSSAGRNSYRRFKGAKMRTFGADHFADFDASLEKKGTYENISGLEQIFEGANTSRKSVKSVKQDAFATIKKAVWDADPKRTSVGKEILRMVRDGQIEDALRFLDRVGTNPSKGGLTDEQKDKLKEVITKEAAKIKTSEAMKTDRKATMDSLYEQVGKLGFKMDRKLFNKITSSTHQTNKFLEMIGYEKSLKENPADQKAKSPVSDLNKDLDERHRQTMQVLEDIRDLLQDLNMYSKENATLETFYQNRHEYVASDGEDGEELSDIADRRHITPFIRRGAKAVATAPFKAVKVGGKAVKFAHGQAKAAAKKARKTDRFNKILGDKSENAWRDKTYTTTISEGEIIVPNEEPEENAVGSTGTGNKNKKNNENGLYKIIKSIERGIKIIAGNSIADSAAEGFDQDTNVDRRSMTDYINSAKRKYQGLKHYTTQFVNGRPVKIFKDKNGDENIDPSSAENKETMKKVKEQEDTQKGILSSLKSLPSMFSGLFGKKDDEEKEESWVSKAFDKLKTGIGIAGGVAAGALGLGIVKDEVIPRVEPWWNETVKPYLDSAWAGKEEGFGKLIYFFNPENQNGLVAKVYSGLNWVGAAIQETGRWLMEDFIPYAAPIIGRYISDGVDWALTDLLPKAISSVISNFPKIITGIGSGILAGIKGIFSGDDDDDVEFDGADGHTATADTTNTANSLPMPKWMNSVKGNFETSHTKVNWDDLSDMNNSSVNYKKSDQSQTTEENQQNLPMYNLPWLSVNSNFNPATWQQNAINNTQGQQPQTQQPQTQANNNVGPVVNPTYTPETPSGNEYPKGIYQIPKNFQGEAKRQFDKVRDRVINFGSHGPMTVYEILDSSLYLATDDVTGAKIRGYDFLKYPSLSKDLLGIYIKLDADDARENFQENNVTSINSDPTKKIAVTGAKAAFSTLLKDGAGLGGASNVMKATGAYGTAMKYTGKGLRTVGNAVSIVPFLGGPLRTLGSLIQGTGKIIEAPSRTVAKGFDKLSDAAPGVGKRLGRTSIKEDAMAKIAEEGEDPSKSIWAKVDEIEAEKAQKKQAKLDKKKAKADRKKNKKKRTMGDRIHDFIYGAETVDDAAEAVPKKKSLLDKAKDGAKGLVDKAKTGIKNTKDKVVNKVKEAGKGKMKKAAAAIDNTAFGDFVEKAKKAIDKLFKDDGILKQLANGLKKLGVKVETSGISKFAKKIGTEVAEYLLKKGGKLAAKAGAKIAAYSGTALIALVADAIVSFGFGFAEANVILGVKEQPNFFIRVLCGLAKAISETLCLGLLPLTWMCDKLIDLCDLLGVDVSGIRKKQKELDEEHEAYMAKTGEKMSEEDFLKKDRWDRKLARKAKDGWSKVKGFFGFEDEEEDEKKDKKNDKKAAKDPKQAKLEEKASKSKKKKDKDEKTAAKVAKGGTAGGALASFTASIAGLTKNKVSDTAVKASADKASKTNKDNTEFETAAGEALSQPFQQMGMLEQGVTETSMAMVADAKITSTMQQQEKLRTEKYLSSNIAYNDSYWNMSKQLNSDYGVMSGIAGTTEMSRKVLLAPFAMMSSLQRDIDKTVQTQANKSRGFFSQLGSSIKGIFTGDIFKQDNSRSSGTSGTGYSSGSTGSTKKEEKKDDDSILDKVGSAISGAIGGIFGNGSGIWGRGNNDLSDAQVASLAKKSNDNAAKRNTKVSNNTFISQRDSKYANKEFNIKGDRDKQTIKDSGCAPAAAAMAVNGTMGAKNLSMERASDLALKYKLQNDGVNAAYFSEEFARNGMNAQYITTDNPSVRRAAVQQQLSNNSRVVLMGSDNNNKSKKDSPYGPNPHYVVANGMSKDGKYIYINDPEAKKGNIKYLASKVLNNSTLGIAASAARGSNLNNSKAMTKIMNSVGRGLPGADVAEQCWNFLRSNGFSEESAAGLLGNFKQESGMDPAALQSGRGPAAGLYQMETYGDYNSRWGKMAKHAQFKGKDWTDLESQLEYMILEMPEQFKKYTGHGVHTYATGAQAWWPTPVTVEEFKALKDIAKATEIFERVFERASIPRMEKRIQSAQEYYQRFTGKFAQTGPMSIGGSGENTEQQQTWVDKLYSVFGGLAEAYGLKTPEATTEGGTSGTPGAVGGNAQQQALVAAMKSKEGQLAYSQVKRDPEGGSADCSSTVQWAYKKVLQVDPGSWTGAMETDSDTYVVTRQFDESQMQPGDEILYDGHVEMYMGGGKMIGHGGGADGKTPGPTVKPLDDQGRFKMVKRWVGFQGGNGSGLYGRGSDVSRSNNRLEYASRQLPNQRAYTRAEKLISSGKTDSWLPELDVDEDTQVTALSDNGKFIDITPRDNKNKPIYVAKGSSDNSNLTNYLLSSTLTRIRDNANTSSNDTTTLLKSIIQLLGNIAVNTEQLNNIFKLLSEYLTILNSKGSDSKSAILARQSLITAMQGQQQNGPNEQLMRLIKSAEEIASQ